jgi:hypothetical protein
MIAAESVFLPQFCIDSSQSRREPLDSVTAITMLRVLHAQAAGAVSRCATILSQP